MKKLMWFLLGFCLIVFPVKWAYSAEVWLNEEGQPYDACVQDKFSDPQWWDGLSFAGYYSDCASANTAVGKATHISCGAFYQCTVGKQSAKTTTSVAVVILSAYYQTTPPVVDTDGDGIPDECDFYPDDPSPYQFKKIGWMSDNSFAIYITDRGDYYSHGDMLPEGTLLDFYDYNAPWLDPDPNCTENYSTGSEGGSISPESNPLPGAAPTGSPPGGDPDYSDGTAPDGTESGADQKIISNTKATADNIAAQGVYLKDINKSIQDGNRESAGQSGTLASIDKVLGEISGKLGDGSGIPVAGDGDGDGDGAGDGEAAWDGVGHGDVWSDGSMTDLVPGTDFDEHGDLADEGFIVSLLANNPIKAAFDASGFALLNPYCSVNFNLGDLGQHEISICEFEPQVQLMGGILFGISCIMGLLVIARGI